MKVHNSFLTCNSIHITVQLDASYTVIWC